ncbi:MAG: beta-ketoacyl-ACP synthase II [Chloroflexota bacterium]
MNRVVVTGIGAISPLGLSMEETWVGLMEGRSGVGAITLFDVSAYPTKFGAEVKGFDPLNYLDRKEVRHMDRFCQFAVVAASQAIQAAQLKVDANNESDIGVFLGSGIGGLTSALEQHLVLIEKGVDRVSPFTATMMISDIAAGQTAIALGIKGPNVCITSSCASSSDAIGMAFELVRRGDAIAMLAGGSEAVLNTVGFAAFCANRAMSVRNGEPQRASRPFDATRDGMVMGEGGAVLVMENLEFALSRGAPILAEVAGYGATADAYHVTQPAPEGEGGVRAMRLALKRAGLEPQAIDYINAHGTSTPLNDRVETQAIKTVFGDYAYRVPISSTKSMLGHLLGAAGGIEAAISIYTMLKGIIPPTINLTHPDPECDLDYVPNEARRAVVRTAMSNAFGFGGHNSVLIFKEFKD